MRILHFGYLDSNARTGTGIAVLALANSISSVDSDAQNYIVHQVSRLKWEILELHIENNSATWVSSGFSSRFLLQIIRDKNFNLIHYHGCFSPLIEVQILFTKVKLVWSSHGGFSHRALMSKHKFLKLLYLKTFYKLFCLKINHFFALTNIEANGFEKYVSSKTTVSVLPNTLVYVDPNRKKDWKINMKSPIVMLCRGEIVPKGIDRLKSLALSFPDFQFNAYVTNMEIHKQEFDNLLQDSVPNFNIYPSVYGKTKEKIIRESLAIISLSRWEGFGVTLIEGASYGKSLLVSPECDLAETIETNNLGKVIKNTDSFKNHINDVEEIARSRINAFDWFTKNCSPQIVGEQALKTYTRITGK